MLFIKVKWLTIKLSHCLQDFLHLAFRQGSRLLLKSRQSLSNHPSLLKEVHHNPLSNQWCSSKSARLEGAVSRLQQQRSRLTQLWRAPNLKQLWYLMPHLVFSREPHCSQQLLERYQWPRTTCQVWNRASEQVATRQWYLKVNSLQLRNANKNQS